MTVTKAANRSGRMRTDDFELAFAICKASVTESSAVSVDWSFLKLDLVEDNSFECFGYEWKERDRSVGFYKISV